MVKRFETASYERTICIDVENELQQRICNVYDKQKEWVNWSKNLSKNAS